VRHPARVGKLIERRCRLQLNAARREVSVRHGWLRPRTTGEDAALAARLVAWTTVLKLAQRSPNRPHLSLARSPRGTLSRMERWALLATVALALLPPPSVSARPAAAGVRHLVSFGNGAWCWFADPRVI
jgi:hypothetical protein